MTLFPADEDQDFDVAIQFRRIRGTDGGLFLSRRTPFGTYIGYISFPRKERTRISGAAVKHRIFHESAGFFLPGTW
jgi:hypothetical protein